jgi:hypothetical protein
MQNLTLAAYLSLPAKGKFKTYNQPSPDRRAGLRTVTGCLSNVAIIDCIYVSIHYCEIQHRETVVNEVYYYPGNGHQGQSTKGVPQLARHGEKRIRSGVV